MRLKLQKHRKKAGLTQEQLADKLGVSLSAVKKWECVSGNTEARSTRNPDISRLKEIAKILGVDISDLF